MDSRMIVFGHMAIQHDKYTNVLHSHMTSAPCIPCKRLVACHRPRRFIAQHWNLASTLALLSLLNHPPRKRSKQPHSRDDKDSIHVCSGEILACKPCVLHQALVHHLK
ncbi:putative glutathione s-transferase protein [Alternaria sp. MG1]|nr:putative glutathione s-transferase protein [Alternaria sp. MG1]